MLSAIIQARMSSTRLPGKVLMEVMGKPLLLYQLERVKKVSQIKQIIVATTVNKEDDPIAKLCKEKSILYFRGSEEDVLERYYLSASQFQADPVIRLTADCPLLDPDILNKLINTYKNNNYDYVHTGLTYAEGLDCEIFSFRVLKIAYEKARLESEREHALLYLHNHKSDFHIFSMENSTDDSKYRFTVDEPEDYEVVKILIENLYRKTETFDYQQIKQFLDSHYEIFRLNSNIIRNEGLSISLQNDKLINN